MKKYYLALLILFAVTINAQVYSTASPSGKGKNFGSVQVFQMKYLGSWSTGGWAQYTRGLTDRVDGFVLAGVTHYDGATQPYVGVGSNVNLGKLAGFDVSIYDYVTVPLARRDEASTVFLDAALITSRTFGKVTPYAGVNLLVPIGNTHQSTFTPPQTERQWVLGLAFPVGTWSAMAEYDAGDLRSFGVSLGRGF